MSIHFSFFFFSSRRRHTRLQGDWSSDVCSSDLLILKDKSHGRPRSIRSALFGASRGGSLRSEEHTSELQSPCNLVCRLLLEKKKLISLLWLAVFTLVLFRPVVLYCVLVLTMVLV